MPAAIPVNLFRGATAPRVELPDFDTLQVDSRVELLRVSHNFHFPRPWCS